MKKLMLFITILAFPIIIFAKEVEIKDIGLKVNVDDNFMIFTRDDLDNNANLDKLGITKEYLEKSMNTNGIYLDMVDGDKKYEVLVVIPDIALIVDDISSATDDMLDSLKTEIVKKTGAKISSIYKAKHNFIFVDYYDENTKYYIVNYYTVENSKGYNFQLQKRTEITDSEKALLKKIVDSVSIEDLNKENESNKQETSNGTKANTNSKKSFDYKNIIIGAIIGAVVGLFSYLIGLLFKKKKSS